MSRDLATCNDTCRWKCLGEAFLDGDVTEEELRWLWKSFHPTLHGAELKQKVEEIMEDAWGQD